MWRRPGNKSQDCILRKISLSIRSLEMTRVRQGVRPDFAMTDELTPSRVTGHLPERLHWR